MCMFHLWCDGHGVDAGYVGDEKASAETLDSGGWLKTGDLCYFDSEGFLYIVDRLKELIKYKAYQVRCFLFFNLILLLLHFSYCFQAFSRFPLLNWNTYFSPILKLLMLQ